MSVKSAPQHRIVFPTPKRISRVRTTSPQVFWSRFQSSISFIGGTAVFNQFAPVSTPQDHGSPIARFATHIVNLLIWIGSLTSPHVWPGAATAQASASERNATQSDQKSDSLEPGKPIERELSGGQSHSYKITMVSGQYLHVVVEQKGIDVAVSLFAPDGKKISDVNSERVIEGAETVSAISESTGAYLIEARSPEKTAKTGRYEIKVEELRVATAEDKYRVAGDSVFREAAQLQNGTLEARRKSVEKYHEALGLYRRASDRESEAGTLKNIGAVYWRLGDMQKAMEKFNEALPIFRAAGDRRGEAITLNNIGAVYRSMGDRKKAMEKYNEALPIWRAAGDRRGEAETLNNIGLVYRTLGDTQKALEKYNEALPLRRAAGDRGGEAVTVNNIGVVYWSVGDAQKAMEKFNEALPLRRAVGDRNGEAATILGVGEVYRSMGDMQKAMEKLNEALSIFRAAGDRVGEAVTLNNTGLVYQSMGDMQKAMEKLNEALPLRRAAGDRNGEAVALENIGVAYWLLGDDQKALEKFNEALPLRRLVGDRDGEASTLLGI